MNSLVEEYKKDLNDFKILYSLFIKNNWVVISQHPIKYPAYSIYAIRDCCFDKARVKEAIEHWTCHDGIIRNVKGFTEELGL